MKTTTVLGFLVIAATGCVDTSEEVDGKDDSFTGDGKADSGGITEGSRKAKGVLRVANEVSLEALRERAPDGVGLARNVVDNIADFRLGDDGLAGTADDGRFDSLAELDAIPFVGPIAFKKLLAYAEANNFVPHGTIVNGTTDVPASLVAYREGVDGPWQPATIKSPTSFEIEVDSAYIVAVACESSGGDVTVVRIGQFADEGDVAAFCGSTLQEGTHKITGHMVQAGRVIAGTAAQRSSTPNWDFSISPVDGTYDLVASTDSAVAVRRGIVVGADTAVAQPIDIAQEGLPLVAVPITVANATSTEAVTARVTLRPKSNTLSATVFSGAPANAKVIIPTSLLATDRQRASVTATEGNFSRSLSRVVAVGANTTVTLPPRLENPQWSITNGDLDVRFTTAPSGDFFTVEAFASSADGAKFFYHDLEVSKRFVTEAGLIHGLLDTAIPGFKPEWKIDFNASYTRDILATGTNGADSTTSSFDESVNPPTQLTARIAPPRPNVRARLAD